MPASDWLADRHTEVAADRILDAAEELFTRRDPTSIGMNEIAKAAGCSRATLYRYFENREALRGAYVARETHRLAESLDVDQIDDSHERLVVNALTALRLVRESPALSAWFVTGAGALGAEMAERSDVITGLAKAFVTTLGHDDPEQLADRTRWLIRAITSLLIFPGHDESDERAMLTQFVAPVVVPAGKVSRARG